MGILAGSKNWLDSRIIAIALDRIISDLGEVTQVKVDTEGKQIFMRVQLDGEPGPIDVNILQYEISNSHITIKRIHTSRSWIDKALRKFNIHMDFDIPSSAISWIAEKLF